MEINKSFGKKLRMLRKARHWTIEDMSFESEINRNYLGDLERGIRNPTLKILKKIADTFNISLSELLKDVE